LLLKTFYNNLIQSLIPFVNKKWFVSSKTLEEEKNLDTKLLA